MACGEVAKGTGLCGIIGDYLVDIVWLMEGDGSVGAIAGNGYAKKFGEGADGKFLNTTLEVSLELVED